MVRTGQAMYAVITSAHKWEPQCARYYSYDSGSNPRGGRRGRGRGRGGRSGTTPFMPPPPPPASEQGRANVWNLADMAAGANEAGRERRVRPREEMARSDDEDGSLANF